MIFPGPLREGEGRERGDSEKKVRGEGGYCPPTIFGLKVSLRARLNQHYS